MIARHGAPGGAAAVLRSVKALRPSSHTWRFDLQEPLGLLAKSSAGPNGKALHSSTKSLLYALQVRPEQSDPPELKGRWLGVWAWRPEKRPLSCLGSLHLGGDEDLGPSPSKAGMGVGPEVRRGVAGECSHFPALAQRWRVPSG